MKKLLVNAATKREKLSVLFHKSSDEAKKKEKQFANDLQRITFR